MKLNLPDELEIEQIQKMISNCTVKPIGEKGAIQIHWMDNDSENSITFFSEGEASEMKRWSSNESVWLGNVRFTRTT